MARARRPIRSDPPFLKRVWMEESAERPLPREEDQALAYPFALPLCRDGDFEIRFDNPVTILVGENGTGKSTLLEALAVLVGFSEGGGGFGHRAVEEAAVSGVDGGVLAEHLRAAWLPRVSTGFFFRAETFFTLSRYLDEVGSAMAQYLMQSHGEGFLNFFEERLGATGIYIFDEPESALSPARQFDFLKLLRRAQRDGKAQIIMATHSPILMALPHADLRQIDAYGIHPVALEDTAHFRLYREFALYPHETVEAMIE